MTENKFKCPKCKCYKNSEEFSINKKGNRIKTCKPCETYKKQWMKEKKDFTYELDENWMQHPLYKNYYCNESGNIINNKTKKLMGRITEDGYITITITHEKKQITIRAHRFIYECYNGIIENNELVINHINEIKSDNSIDNLELITQSENIKKASGKSKLPRIARKCFGKAEDDNEYCEYKSLHDASRKIGCNPRSIQYVCDGVHNTCISADGKRWIFKYDV